MNCLVYFSAGRLKSLLAFVDTPGDTARGMCLQFIGANYHKVFD